MSASAQKEESATAPLMREQGSSPSSGMGWKLVGSREGSPWLASGSPGNARPRGPGEVRDVMFPTASATVLRHPSAEPGDLPPHYSGSLGVLTSRVLAPRRKHDPGERLARSRGCRLANRGICCLGVRGGALGWGRPEGELKTEGHVLAGRWWERQGRSRARGGRRWAPERQFWAGAPSFMLTC